MPKQGGIATAKGNQTVAHTGFLTKMQFHNVAVSGSGWTLDHLQHLQFCFLFNQQQHAS